MATKKTKKKTKKKQNIDIGSRIQIIRGKRNLTQEVLSEKLDLSTQYISDIERGACGISIETLIKLCKTLNVSSDYLLFGDRQSKNIEDTILKISRLTPEEQALINRAINITIAALTLHDEGEVNNDKTNR